MVGGYEGKRHEGKEGFQLQKIGTYILLFGANMIRDDFPPIFILRVVMRGLPQYTS